MKLNQDIDAKLTERFGHDVLIALATAADGLPSVRAVNALYADGCFHVITHAKSGKMQHIAANPHVGVCGEWFTGHGVAENAGHVLREENAAMMARLRKAFADWYGNGHINERDPDTILLRIRLTDGVLFWQGTRYDVDFT